MGLAAFPSAMTAGRRYLHNPPQEEDFSLFSAAAESLTHTPPRRGWRLLHHPLSGEPELRGRRTPAALFVSPARCHAWRQAHVDAGQVYVNPLWLVSHVFFSSGSREEVRCCLHAKVWRLWTNFDGLSGTEIRLRQAAPEGRRRAKDVPESGLVLQPVPLPT